MNTYSSFLLIVVCQAICISAFSQHENLKFERIGTEDGLSQSNVMCILQDSRGFMWFGTRGGLNKYDGYKFTVYKNNTEDENTPSQDWISDILEDTSGNLWIATLGGGLDMFDWGKEKFIHYKHKGNNALSIQSNRINCLWMDNENNLWIGSEDNGLSMLDRKNNTFIHYAHDKNNPESISGNSVNMIIEDRHRNLWIATDLEGLNFFDKKTKTFKHFRHDDKNTKSIASNKVEALFTKGDDQLWVGTRDGLDLFDMKKEEFRHFKAEPGNNNSLGGNVILSLAEDKSGSLWIGTENGGLSILKPNANIFENYLQDDVDKLSLNNNSIWSLYKDVKGDMWVGTFNGGINFVNRDAGKFTHYRHTSSPNSLSNNSVWSILEDSKNNIWIGTDGGGLNLFDRRLGIFTTYKREGTSKGISGNYVLGLAEDKKGNIWIGTWGDGVTVFNPEKKTYKYFKYDPHNPHSINYPNVWTVFRDAEDNMWIGTYGGGVGLYDELHNGFIHFSHDATDPLSVGSNTISIFFEDRKGNLWIGTNGGLNLFNKKDKTFVKYLHDDSSNSITSNTVYSILEDRSGNLWVGTEKGLNYFNTETHKFTNYYTKDGLPGHTIFSLLFDEHENLWISTNNGISKFNPKSKVFKNFGVHDGAQSTEFKKAGCRSRSGQLYFGGTNGFNEFFPDSIKENDFDPPLVLTGFQLFNKTVRFSDDPKEVSLLKKNITNTKEITLSYKESVFSFEFASLNYSDPEKKRYAYMMEGFDKDWNNVGTKHTATYTNLDPGSYVFKVRGLNNTGNWSANTINLKIKITPPIWGTWWFRTTLALLVAGSVFSFYWIRITSIRRRQAELEKQVKERTNEVVQQKEDLLVQSEYLRKANETLINQREEILLKQEETEKAKTEAEEARLEAEQANQAKSVFLATMSHEIRTPMNGVIGMASLLSETTQTIEQQEYTETIKSCGENLLGVINDILDYSKIESGNLELEERDFDLRTCIEEVLEVFASKGSQIGLDLIYEIDYEVPSQIIGDSLRLRQVLMNLVSNAIKFTQQGEIFIGVHLLSKKSDQVELGFEVRDTGIGIAHDKLDRLFKAFSQVDSSTTRKYGGTGLGLVICEKLVKLMGGQILVESQPGRSTTFTFTIHAKLSQQAARMYVHHNVAGLEGKKVLLVDDNSTNRIILKNQMLLWKLVPTLAISGKQAQAILSEIHDFDLIVTDMQMPEMDGVELAQSIRQANKTIPIILLSSIGDDRCKAHPELFSSVLTKPVRQSTLHNHIVTHLVQRQHNHVVNEPAAKKKLSVEFSRRYPLNILIAEDNPVNQKLTERVLTKLGYKPSKALNGQEALNALEQQHYDVILMDVQMPVMDGLETTRKIRLRDVAQPFIIAMTANAMQGDKEMCLQAGMDDYISKPVKLEELVSVLEKWACTVIDNSFRKIY